MEPKIALVLQLEDYLDWRIPEIPFSQRERGTILPAKSLTYASD